MFLLPMNVFRSSLDIQARANLAALVRRLIGGHPLAYARGRRRRWRGGGAASGEGAPPAGRGRRWQGGAPLAGRGAGGRCRRGLRTGPAVQAPPRSGDGSLPRRPARYLSPLCRRPNRSTGPSPHPGLNPFTPAPQPHGKSQCPQAFTRHIRRNY